ncbi:MAG: ABC transporter permease [Halobacteriales archaeon]
MTRLATATRLRLRELTRQPFTLAMLLVLPPTVIEMYGLAMASFPQLPSLGTDPKTAGYLTGTLFAVAFLAGLVGLFQVIGARRGDERAAVAGFPRRTMLASRLVAMVAVVLAATAIAAAVLAYRVDVADAALAVGVLALAGLVYGLLGVAVGTLVPRELEGSIVLVFLADLDNALSSGLFPVTYGVDLPVLGEVTAPELLPLYHPHALFTSAVLDGSIAAGHVGPSLAWVAGLVVVAFLAYGRSTGEGWAGLAGRVGG